MSKALDLHNLNILEGELEGCSTGKIDQAALQVISNHVVTLSLINVKS